jgi:hypothetical protein
LKYLTVYEVETDDLPATLAVLEQAAQQMPFDPLFERASRRTFAYTAIGERREDVQC